MASYRRGVERRADEVIMGRYLWGRLHHGVGRTVALLLGVLVATASFVVLTGAARTIQLRTVGRVGHNYRSAYDILVRPKGSVTGLERSRGLVPPNYLSRIFGGISLRQYHTVAHLPGVEVAAPIAMIGYIVPRTAVRLHIPGDLGGAARRLYRVDRTWVFDRGLSRVRDAGGFVYVTRSPVTSPLVLGPSGVVSSEHVGGRSVPVCRAPGLRPASSPFAVSARIDVGCFSRPPAPPASRPGDLLVVPAADRGDRPGGRGAAGGAEQGGGVGALPASRGYGVVSQPWRWRRVRGSGAVADPAVCR